MADPVTIGIIGLGLSAIGLVTSFAEGKKADKRTREANKLRREAEKKEEKAANLRALRAKRAAVREAQRRRADVTSGAVVAGAAAPGGSALPGARGSISTQLTQNLSFLDQSLAFSTQAARLLGRSSDIANKPAGTTGKSLAAFGGTIFGGREVISDFFA